MYNEIITLISKTANGSDDYGNIIESQTERQILAKLQSIGLNEFYQAQAQGYKPELKFVIADYLDYQGEQRLRYAEYEGEEKEYTIIRTYRKGNELELTCEKGVEP